MLRLIGRGFMASEKRERQHTGEREIGLGIDWVESLYLIHAS